MKNRFHGRAIVSLIALVALLATGCAHDPDDRYGRNPDAPPVLGPGTGGESRAIGLVNLWRVSGVVDEEIDTWLRLDVPEFQLWRACGMIHGSWQATENLFLASTYGAGGECAAGGAAPRVAWLESVTGFRSAGDGWELSDADGAVVATLTVDGAPEPIASAAVFFTEPPEVTDAVRDRLRQLAPLPALLSPVTAVKLAGRWVPVGYAVGTDPHVVFDEDGTWTGSDGCNTSAGRWAVDGEGALLTTSGVSSLMACEGAPVPSWVAQTRLAGFDGAWLRLLDAGGSEFGRLERG